MPTMSTTLTVRVQPRASRNACVVEKDRRVRVALTAPPVGGAANEALIEFVANCLDLPKRRVLLAGGEKSRDKTIAIDGLDIETILRRLRGEK